jgi:hypothetical protein
MAKDREEAIRRVGQQELPDELALEQVMEHMFAFTRAFKANLMIEQIT